MDNNNVAPLKDIVYGAAAGMVGKLIEFPFDTVKVRLQSSAKFSKASTLEVIRYTYRNEGFINGFYKGLKAPLVGACFESAVLFFSYEISSAALSKVFSEYRDEKNRPPLWSSCLSGAFSGLAASFVLTPVELIKCKLQVSNISNHKLTLSYTTIIRQVLEHDGIIGLWNGLSSTLVREIFGTAIWFGTYELSNRTFQKMNDSERLTEVNYLISGALAGVVFNFSIFPADTVKSNIQTLDLLQHRDKNLRFTRVLGDLISKPGGVRNLYKGLSITLIRAAPANAAIFYVYEVLKNKF